MKEVHQCPSCGGFCKKSGCERQDTTKPCRHFLTGIFNNTTGECPYCEVDSAKELLSEALYALEYGLDMTKPDDMSGCDCPMCVVSRKIRKVLK